ncbi:uncharacterized protein LOC142025272 [Carettochelys insculpta]|uniref:uncharacterized protein LOC142025272 n=1 Tax=Carettochelys insculpta TaxID=44489 RepID=UPI003EB6D01F
MEPWFEVVVVPAGSQELSLEHDTPAGEGGPPAKKRPRRSPPPTEAPMEWESLELAGPLPPQPTPHCTLADGPAPAPGSPLRPASHLGPPSSASCGPGRGDPVHQRRKRPARSKRRKSMGNRGLAAIAPLVRGILSAFASGLRLAKLLEIMRSQHGVDAEALCRAVGRAGVLGLLAQVPGLRVCTPERGPQCRILLDRALAGDSAPAPASEVPPCGSQTQATPRLAPVSSFSCGPGRRDLALRRPKKPAQPKRAEPMGNRDAAATLAPLLRLVLRPFPLGLGLPKLLEAVRRDLGLDLVALSQEAGYRDVPALLGQVPGLQLHRSRHSSCTVHLEAGGLGV